VPLAKTLATLDVLSGGRLDVGLGLGNPGPRDGAFEFGGERRLARFNEGVATPKALWADGTASRAGTFAALDDAPMEPKPLQRPRPRLWFGGRHPNMLRRAVREADGWMGAGSSTLADFVEQSARVRELLAAEGRDPVAFGVAKRLYLAIDADEGRAERRLRAWFGAYYGNPDMASRVCVWGPREKVHETIRAVLDAGADMVLLNPVFDLPMHLEELAQTLLD
jgi:alkanesulfonate monooxygenase SsuD/methylene tetrahydromethanopterin reductase-like flavin-dependent oxidoreductase (luciferase family)